MSFRPQPEPTPNRFRRGCARLACSRQLGVGQAGARLGHLGQPEVDRITEDCGQQRPVLFGLGPVLQVGEVAAEARPVVHVHQQFGDLDARQ